MTPPAAHKWAFAPRFRRHAFGWRSQPAVQRVREAAAEIQKVAKRDPALAAVGAVLFLEKVSPALEQVDSVVGAGSNMLSFGRFQNAEGFAAALA